MLFSNSQIQFSSIAILEAKKKASNDSLTINEWMNEDDGIRRSKIASRLANKINK